MLKLDSVLSGDLSSIATLKSELCKNGWIFVTLSDKMVNDIDSLVSLMNNFFSENESEKDKYTEEKSIFGYQKVNHKESLRWLTYERFKKDNFPSSLKDKIENFTSFMDDTMNNLALQCCKSFFNKSPNELGDDFDIALFSEDKKGSRFGMLDVAHYLNVPGIGHNENNNLGTIPPKNCVEHFDPGLLSLSFYSSSPGLQLLDLTTNKWIDGPCNTIKEQKNIAIIWCGAAANKIDKEFKPAMHRVEYPELSEKPQPRMAIWYEICTSSQETDYLKFENTNELPPNIFVEKKPAKSISSSVNKKVSKNSIEKKTGVPMSKSKRPRKTVPNKMIPVNQDIEASFGVPMSKIEPEYDPFAPNFDLEAPQKEETGVKTQIKKNPFSQDIEANFGVPMSKIGPSYDNFIPNFDLEAPKKEETVVKTQIKKNPFSKDIEANFGVPMSKIGPSFASLNIPDTKLVPLSKGTKKPVKKMNISNQMMPSIELNFGVPSSKVALPHNYQFDNDDHDDPMDIV